MTVDFEECDGIVWLTLSRPERLNAVSPQLVDDLCQRLAQIRPSDARVVILRGRGRAFCAGYDLKEDASALSTADRRQRLEREQEMYRQLRQLAQPTIAAVHGYALGAGCALALACDLIIAEQGTRFGFPEVTVGRSVGGGMTRLLPLSIGMARAKELVLLGDQFDAERALQLGLINAVVTPDSLTAAAERIAHRLRELPATSVAAAKTLLRLGSETDQDAIYAAELEAMLQTDESPEAASAAQRFRERP